MSGKVRRLRYKSISRKEFSSFLEEEEEPSAKGTRIFNVKEIGTIKPYARASKDYIEMFWVGVMDGKGQIQVNHKKNLHLEYQFIIRLEDFEENHAMLINIAKNLKGEVLENKKKKEFFWSIHSRGDDANIIALFNVFEKYPPLTSRLQCQLDFALKCKDRNSVPWCLDNRTKKYKDIKQFEENTKEFFKGKKELLYFPVWLSGYIEIKANFKFKTRKTNTFFSIQSYDDFYLYEAIQRYFYVTSRLRTFQIKGKNLCVFDTHRRKTISLIIKHCLKYPLLGKKKCLLLDFILISVLPLKK